MGNFETALVIKTKVAQRLPVFFHHAGWSRAQLFGYCTQCALTRRQTRGLAPAFVLDRFNQSWIAILCTQELCVRLRSVMTVLCSSGDGSDHFSFWARQHTVGGPHIAKLLETYTF